VAVPPTEIPVTPAPAKTEVLVKPPAQLAWLVIYSGPRAGKDFRLGEITNIGRDATQNDIVIDDPAVSGQHARIKLEKGQFVLYDLASTNGTFIKDPETGEWKEIHKQALADKDRIKMGNTILFFMEVREKKEE
jgi:pSer/pThr/pTyr-binding forkhead associated (FHA) protein